MTIRNPLFDPRSDYNKRRMAVDPPEKLQGYFHWLSELKDQARRKAEESRSVWKLPPESSGQPAADPVYSQAAKGAHLPPRVIVLGYRDEAADGIEDLNAAADASLLKLGGSRLLVTVELTAAGRPSPCACRAYLLEPSYLRRLLAAAGKESSTGGPDLAALRAVFGRRGLAGNPMLIRLLADVPEIEGRLVNGKADLEVQLPADDPPITRSDFYARNCLIVVVLDQPLPEDSHGTPTGQDSPGQAS